jgi:predicted ATPase
MQFVCPETPNKWQLLWASGDRPLAILRRVTLKGFKSIKEMDLELRPLNVLIGANGAGKSNLVSFFKMLNEMMAGRLQQYVGTTGRAQSLLYYGPKETPQMEAELEFGVPGGTATYFMQLTHAAVDTLVFSEERLKFNGKDSPTPGEQSTGIRGGHPESHLAVLYNLDHPTTDFDRNGEQIRTFLAQCRPYHFHDTSPSARVRRYCYISDNRVLMADGGNLPAFLRRLREDNNSAYQQIVSTIRLIAPFFRDFDLEAEGPEKKEINLNWLSDATGLNTAVGTGGWDQLFGPHQLSDGTLRAMCLITLLLQPENELPDLILVDEPELGLHPYALHVIASLFKKASRHTQVLVSTQSSSFLDHFDPEDIIVASREGNESVFSRPEPENLEKWLEEYSLGEVWEKNVIGGGPH